MNRTKRLLRLGNIYTECPVYFITACTQNRRPLLNNRESHEAFVSFCHKALERGVHVGNYVLMPDHLHFFVCFGMGAPDLSIWMKSLKNSLSKLWRSMGIDAPHWQKGFFDHVLRSEQSHSEKWLYVRDNPVRAGLVESSELWPFAGEIDHL